MSNLAQRSFTGGELAPALYARTDLAKYATGLRTCRNFLVNRYGGVSNRAGTEFAAPTKNNGVGRMLPFQFNAAQTYVLEFGDRTLRFVQDAGHVVSPSATAWADATAYLLGDLVSDSGVQYYCTVAHSSSAALNEPGAGTAWQSNWYALAALGTDAIYEIPTPYLAADLSTLQIMQSGDVVSIVHPSYAPRELTRFDHTRWTLGIVVFGPSVAAPTNVAVAGGSTIADNTYYAVTAISTANGDEGLPTTVELALKGPGASSVTVTWDPVPGALQYNIYRSTDGQTFGFVGASGGVPSRHSNTTWSTDSAGVSTTTIGSYVASTSQARMTVLSSVNDRPQDGAFIITGEITVSTDVVLGASASGRIRAYYSRDGEARVDAGIVGSASVNNTGDTTVSFTGTIIVPDNGYASVVVDLVPEVSNDTAGTTASCDVSEATSPDNEISWRTTGTGFVDTGVAIQFDIAPPTNPTLFVSDNGYPAAVGSFQQRRIFANTNTKPEQSWASRTAVPASFTTSTPLEDDDAVSFTLSSRQLNAIQHLVDMGRLVVFTSGGEWIIEGDNSNILKPSAINARQFAAHGSATLPPIAIGTAAIFVQARGTIVRDLTADTVQGLSSNDLTVYAAHLFDGYTIVDWAFAQIPHAIAWVVRSDGALLGLTYLPEQQVWGWHRHDTDGFVENVCVVPEGTEDRVYLVVRRTVNGATVRYIERMATRTITALTDPRDLIFMDAALSYDGRNFDASITMTLSGGVAWDNTETLTVTRSSGTFTADDVGAAVVFYDDANDDTEVLRITIETVVSGTVATGHVSGSVPSSLRAIAESAWGLASIAFSGLDHLEGKAVSVLGDGAVVASPNNADYGTPIVVAAGAITLPEPYVVVHVGLPYLCDLETLDIDTAQGPSLKPFKQLVNKLTVVVEKSRAFFAGSTPPTDDTVDPLENLDQAKFRDVADDYALPDLKTGDYEMTLQGRWNSNGRVFIRQPDPVPVSILAIIPQGMIPPTN